MYKKKQSSIATNQKMGFSPYILLQKYIILLLGQYRQKFYPPFEKFWGRGLVVWIGHQQKTIPALRSEEQVPALGVPPGVGRCRQRTPPYPLFICTGTCSVTSTVFERLRGKRKGLYSPHQGLIRCVSVQAPSRGQTGNGEKAEGFPQGFVEWLSIFLLVCLVMLRGKPLIMSIGSFLHKAETLIIFTPHSLSRCVRA